MSERSDELRQKILGERRALSPESVSLRSKKIRENFLNHFASTISEDSLLGLYRPGKVNPENEPDPSLLLQCDALASCHFAFPRVLNRFHHTMDFAIPLHETDWAVGNYGLPEPRHELPAVRPEEIDMLILPGTVFGMKGERLGRGAGYYDRFLAEARGALRVAFGYDFQVLSEGVPQRSWDAPVDWIITDLRVIETRARY